jgi:uncharacterized membrane protein
MAGPSPTVFHRWIGYHAPALRRLTIAAALGVAAAAIAAPFVRWEVTVLVGWDGAALAFIGGVWPMVLGADAAATRRHATRNDLTRDTARLLLTGAAAASLASVVFALHLAGLEQGSQRGALVAIASVTVVVSWVVLNTVFTVRYAEEYYRDEAVPIAPVDFGGAPPDDPPDFRDFAYVAFTIGMTYQVSDTNLRDRRIRRTVLFHAFLSYLFGVVIVAAGVNIVAGLVA